MSASKTTKFTKILIPKVLGYTVYVGHKINLITTSPKKLYFRSDHTLVLLLHVQHKYLTEENFDDRIHKSPLRIVKIFTNRVNELEI